MRCASPPLSVGAERSSDRYERPTCSRKAARLSISATMSRAISFSRPSRARPRISAAIPDTGSRAYSAMFFPRNRTASASGRRRRPPQAGQVFSGPSHQSFHQISSPVCSASNPESCWPVPKQDGHQPCRELYENRRGSSSSKLLPHRGQARFVEKVIVPVAVRDAHHAPAELQAPSQQRAKGPFVLGPGRHLAHGQLDRVLAEPVQPGPRRRGDSLAVHAQSVEPPGRGPGGEVGVVPLARRDQGRQHAHAPAPVVVQHAGEDALRGLGRRWARRSRGSAACPA